MIHCTNCGQVNTDTSNFCRFCGTKFLQNQTYNESGYEYSPPRPYSWKTDEFQLGENKKRKPQQINQVQPLANQFAANPPPRPQPLVQQQPQNMAYGYHCPRCSSQMMPKVVKRVSTAGWITFAVLMVTTGIFFWIGLLIKEDVRLCPV
ncbi:MAG TPA: zinc-ribbon domain-containing protein, partial [Pyrinomonadaceae bacterium]|nr:zinc-ribbon domain-containing protein [Pyrinomonadaceae bacterium]